MWVSCWNTCAVVTAAAAWHVVRTDVTVSPFGTSGFYKRSPAVKALVAQDTKVESTYCMSNIAEPHCHLNTYRTWHHPSFCQAGHRLVHRLPVKQEQRQLCLEWHQSLELGTDDKWCCIMFNKISASAVPPGKLPSLPIKCKGVKASARFIQTCEICSQWHSCVTNIESFSSDPRVALSFLTQTPRLNFSNPFAYKTIVWWVRQLWMCFWKVLGQQW